MYMYTVSRHTNLIDHLYLFLMAGLLARVPSDANDSSLYAPAGVLRACNT